MNRLSLTERELGSAEAAAAAPVRVLLVEDDPLDAELVLDQLGEHGLVVESRVVERRDDYLAALDQFRPDRKSTRLNSSH